MSSPFPDIAYSALQELWQSEGINSDIVPLVDQFWRPLAVAIATQQQSLNRPMIQGILGGQGTGKTTLCKVLQAILSQWGIRSAALSIDDLYKTYADRRALQQRDPRFVWRGPPGTHDVSLGLQVIDQVLQQNQTIELPQFDKYAHHGQGDRTHAQSIDPIDVLLFEGWFVGTRPVSNEAFERPPEPIVTDSDRKFARDINEALQAYVPLWERLDALIVLNPVEYQLSLDWRWDAEQKAIAQGKTGMSRDQIIEFVHYFWKALHPRIFIDPLIKSTEWTDFVLDINADHQPIRLHSPG